MPTGWTLNLSRSLSLSLTEPCNWGTEDIDRPTTSDAAMRRTTKAVPLSALGLRLARPNCWNTLMSRQFEAVARDHLAAGTTKPSATLQAPSCTGNRRGFIAQTHLRMLV
ncbi:hypothetical protein PF008_g13397 [Phytophthora fragariae]|uniref:Uncharacterized protein n=1 Tax=Phytophthora fragariae TaxID=53985 RepID=A0A6G0RK51_9STRA|nr:hypothetical protein PF008_g13397 [Phytophthora fragariae]